MKPHLRLPRIAALSLAAVLASVLPASAEIRLPNVISDHAVLQRGVPIHIWGWATPGAAVTATLHNQTLPATADRLGEWSVWFQPESAGGPYTLTAKGDGSEGSKTLSDLLIGDVWLASGQSNMEFPLKGFPPSNPLKNGPAEIHAANNPEIRLLLVNQISSDFPLHDLPDKQLTSKELSNKALRNQDPRAVWTTCTPETAAKFSAVAYLFGKNIAADEHVPIGLIDASWGGTIVDAWISLEGLSSNPNLLAAFANRAVYQSTLAQTDAIQAAERRETEAAKAAAQPLPKFKWHPYGPSWMPAGLYNGMIAPLTPYALKGFLWYQGESDANPERAPHYTALFEALIEDWRSHFAQGELPFLFVQISSFDGNGPSWPRVQDAQRRSLALRNTAMAVTNDIGDPNSVHPADKQTVGARLALAAEGMVYGKPIAYQSPLFRQAVPTPGGMQVWFDHAEGLNSKSAKIEGFELAGPDHEFVPAEATVQGETVLVKSTAIPNPTYVRFAWTSVAPPPLYNSAGLPASNFTSEPTIP